ncbi:MAG: isopentenyl phosphate kinase [Chloroflexota bacterium]|nr:isopentenyl phosphate kinase [Chloroflexota bacterium]
MFEAPLFVKLGGSILTDKTRPEAVNRAALHGIATVVADWVREAGAAPLLIAHGGGSFGHYWADRYGTQHGVTDATGWQGFARVTDAMGRLNRIVVQALLAAGISAVGLQPVSSALAAHGSLQHFDVATIERMLRVGLVPVLCGDAVLDQQQGAAIVSTEALFAFLAPRLQPKRIVLLGEAGVFTADPRRDAGAVRIPLITTTNIEDVLAQVGASHGVDVTGGMATKVQAMWQLVQRVPGLEVQLVGTEPAVVRGVLRGETVAEGTIIRG